MDRWVPSIGVSNDFIVERGEASVKSRSLPTAVYINDPNSPDQNNPDRLCIENCFWPTIDETGVRPNKDGDDFLVAPIMGGHIELMSPSVRDLPGAPRFFGHIGVSYSFGGERDLAKEGDPGKLSEPPTEPNQTEFAIVNQGSRTSAEIKSPVVMAGMGMAFSFDLAGRRLRLKPSIEYMYEDIEVSGLVSRGWRTEPGRISPVFIPPEFQRLTLQGNKRQSFHTLGPGLELEMDAVRTGPMIFSLYFETNAYKTLNERGIDFRTSGAPITYDVHNNDGSVRETFTTGPQEAEFKFRKSRWTFLTGVGFRVRYAPE